MASSAGFLVCCSNCNAVHDKGISTDVGVPSTLGGVLRAPDDEASAEGEKGLPCFDVVLDIGSDDSGLVLDTTYISAGPIITHIHEGAVSRWNSCCLPEERVKKFHRIYAVNGVGGTAPEIKTRLASLPLASKTTLSIQGFEVHILRLQKDDRELGIKMVFREQSPGVLVSDMREGTIATWNEQNPRRSVALGDLLLWLDEESLAPKILCERILQSKDVALKVIHYL
eukprot:TRINITY_DN30490_c0_g1_i2.p1 TRINITY_DN30490_c0_g1~~TRINITY_DN30490_c0_g1_i2.p1  ORF type:complete len:227 (-),score=41.55 TRINITY_DN30490_c0_g1_i2:36-716(-)